MRTHKKNKNNKKRNISLPAACAFVVCAILYMSTADIMPSVHADETNEAASQTAAVTPSPTAVATPTPEPTPKYINLKQALEDDASTAEILELIAKRPDPLYLEVDLYNQIITIYELDGEGEYTTVIKQMPCSGGTAARQTESKTPYLLKELYKKINAKYNISARDWSEWGWVHYVINIYEVFLFHSVLYKNSTFTSYIHNSYTNITFPASHGCIRLLTEDTQWIFYNLQDRDIVDLTKNEANPELSQYYQPMPPKDYNCVATRPPDTLIRTTGEPEIDWAILNHKPKNYTPGSFD